MAFVRATKNGNWSDPTVWHTGALPQNGDTVYANGFTVTIDQDVLIGDTNNYNVNAGSFIAGCWYEVVSVGTTNFGSIGGSNTVGALFLATGIGSGTGVAKAVATLSNRSNASSGSVMGGNFTITANVTVWSFLHVGDSGTLLTVTSSAQATIVGNVIELANFVAQSNYIDYTGTGVLTFIGNITTTRSFGINKTSSGTLNAVGIFRYSGGGYSSTPLSCSAASSGTVNITGQLVAGTGNAAHAILINSASITLNIVGIVYGGGGPTSDARGVQAVVAASVNLVGDVYGGTGGGVASTGCGIFSSGNISVVGNIYAGTSNGIVGSSTYSASFALYHTGNSYDAPNGIRAFNVRRFLRMGSVNQFKQIAVNGVDTFVTFYTADNVVFGQASPADVRKGTSYANGNLTGACEMPSPNNVAFNVPVDATVGQAVLRPSDVWDYLRANINTEGSIGERLKRAVIVDDMGKLFVDTLT